MQELWEKVKPSLWGAVGGAIALAIIGFAWGGWVTGGTAQEMAEKSSREAVVARLAEICVEQFNQEAEKVQKLEELKEVKSWKRKDYVEQQGWSTMPGETEADYKVGSRCAELIMELAQ